MAVQANLWFEMIVHFLLITTYRFYFLFPQANFCFGVSNLSICIIQIFLEKNNFYTYKKYWLFDLFCIYHTKSIITLHVGTELCSTAEKKKAKLMKKRPRNLRKYPEIYKSLSRVCLKHELVLQNKTFVLERKLWRENLVQGVYEKYFWEVVARLHEYSS